MYKKFKVHTKTFVVEASTIYLHFFEVRKTRVEQSKTIKYNE